MGYLRGSSLGPTLFLIFINDLLTPFSNFNITLFADDFVLLLSGSNFDTISTDANLQLSLISNWYSSNKLKINSSKSASMFFTRSKSIFCPISPIFIEKDVIPLVFSFRYLGLNFTSDYRWNAHTDYICSKISRNIGLLAKFAIDFPLSFKKKLYYSFVFSVVNFGFSIYGVTSMSNIRRLERLQKRFMKIFFHKNYSTGLHLPFNILPFSRLLFYNIALVLFKFFRLNYLSDLVSLTLRNPQFPLRNYRPYLVPIIRSRIGKSNLSYLCPTICNNIPNDFFFSTSFSMFKSNLCYFLNSDVNIVSLY